MAAPSTSFAQQLKQRKDAFLAELEVGTALDNWVIAVGNEAGDLDSMASALGYAHFAAQADASSSRNYVPLVLTARTDLYLRPENTEALSSAGVPSSALLTIDDLPSSRLAALGAKFALVDHNVLLPPFRSFPDAHDNEADDARVTAIIDHHADEGRHLAASPRLFETAGSCASLVTTHFSPPAPPSADVLPPTIPAPLADLLLSAILIDTGLRPSSEGGKATATDLSAVAHLLPQSSFGGAAGTSTLAASPGDVAAAAKDALLARLAVLAQKKGDVGGMDGRDLLRRDYKEYSEAGVRYGLSTVPLPLSTWLDKAAGQEERWALVLRETRAWMAERRLKLAGVLTSYNHVKKSGKEGKHRRELLLVAEEGAGLDAVFERIGAEEVLQLEEWKGIEEYGRQEGRGEGVRWKVWQQGNAKATRKQVGPVMKKLVIEAAGAGDAK
ncbi:hypothetical protein JCM10207_006706 [Rhodosporidiobolus poonsookiae]